MQVFKPNHPKNPEDARIKSVEERKSERPLALFLKINKNHTPPQTLPLERNKIFRMTSSKNTFGKLLLIFQIFE